MLDIKNVYILAETFKSPIQKHPCSPADLSLRGLFICVNKSEAAAARVCTAGRCWLQGPVACLLPTAFYSYQ